jgi:hypothetical protein
MPGDVGDKELVLLNAASGPIEAHVNALRFFGPNRFRGQTARTLIITVGRVWAVEREGEGGTEKRREKQAGQTLLGGQVGRDAHALERRTSELATRDVVVVNTEKKAKRRRGGWMINSKQLLLVDEKYFDQPSVKVQKKLSFAAQDIQRPCLRARRDREAGRNIAIQKISRA